MNRNHAPLVNLWSPGGSFMVQTMTITSLIPVFYGLKQKKKGEDNEIYKWTDI